MGVLPSLVRSVCYLLFGGIYVLAAVGKLHQPKAVLRAILEYRLVPGELVPLAAAMLPGVELLAGTLMIMGMFVAFRRRRSWVDDYAEAGAWIGAILMVIFMVALTVSIFRGLSMDCGCFDLLGLEIPFLKSSKIGWDVVVRDLVMLVPAWPILAWRK